MTSYLETMMRNSGLTVNNYGGVPTVKTVVEDTRRTGNMSYWDGIHATPYGGLNSGLSNLHNDALADIGHQISSYNAQLTQLQNHLAISAQQQQTQAAYGAMPTFAQVGNLSMGGLPQITASGAGSPYLDSDALLSIGGVSLNEITAKLNQLEAQQAAQPAFAPTSSAMPVNYASPADTMLAQQIEAFNQLSSGQPSSAGQVMPLAEQQAVFAQLSSSGAVSTSSGISGNSSQLVPASQLSMSKEGRDYLKGFEALRLNAYQCSAGVWTIGWGHTGSVSGKPVQPGMTITEAEAEKLFTQDLAHFEKAIRDALGNTQVTPAEFDMVVSLAFNAGAETVANSTLVRKLKAGDREGAAQEFASWNKSRGRVVQGLTNRRREEAAIFRSGYSAAA